MPVTTTDTELIRQVLLGRTAAFGIIVSRYKQYVFTITLRYIPVREEAEELAQDVFIKAFKSLQSFRQESKFSTWLYTIVHTTCISHLRKRAPHTTALEEEKLIVLSERNNYGESNFSEQKSQSALMEEAMKKLPPDEAELLSLYYQAEQSIDEISSITGLSTSNVKVKLHRTRQKLKDILLKHYPHEIVHLTNV